MLLGSVPMLAHVLVRTINDVDIFDGGPGFAGGAVLARSTLVDGLPCADLRDVLEFKRGLNRAKDRAHLGKLRAYLAPPQ